MFPQIAGGNSLFLFSTSVDNTLFSKFMAFWRAMHSTN